MEGKERKTSDLAGGDAAGSTRERIIEAACKLMTKGPMETRVPPILQARWDQQGTLYHSSNDFVRDGLKNQI